MYGNNKSTEIDNVLPKIVTKHIDYTPKLLQKMTEIGTDDIKNIKNKFLSFKARKKIVQNILTIITLLLQFLKSNVVFFR